MFTRSTRLCGWLLLGMMLGVPAASAQTAPMTVEVRPGVVVKVLGLKRVPNLPDIVQIDYEIANNGPAALDLSETGIGRAAYGMNEITLLDFPNKISFRVGVADQCLCTAFPEEPLAAGATFKGWAWFNPPATSPGPFAVRFAASRPILDVPLQ